MGTLRIKLLSDLCTSSGEIYNSSIDTDVCYDRYGFPYIPAKRIKGCLREAAQELRDWGDEIDIEKLFGDKADKRAEVKISNAKLENYDSYRKELEETKDDRITHVQSVLNQFTYIRYQTKIGEGGVAEETSFRTTRVMKKGLVFEANVEIPEERVDDFKKCCNVVRHMGLNRTRGMGEVLLSYDEKTQDEENEPFAFAEYPKSEKSRLVYTITLKSPVLLKSVVGGQTKSEHYIEGSKIIGLAMQHVDNFKEINKDGNMIFSNAYISDGKTRYLPVSASVYQVKDAEKEYDGKTEFEAGCEKIVDNKEDDRQVHPAKECFVSSNTEKRICKMSVYTQLQYHHSRPENKAIGRVDVKDKNSQFYQMESLVEGQQFQGYIIGNTEQIKKIAEGFGKCRNIRLGYSRSTEYGEAKIQINNILAETEEMYRNKMKQFVLKLEAPTILYNQFGAASTDTNVLLEEVKERLNLTQKPEVKKQFLKYRLVGGYNVTWKMPKPVLHAFDMGTTFLLECEYEKELPKQLWIGERRQEGYGEASIYEVPTEYRKEIQSVSKIQNLIDFENTKVTTQLVADIAKKIIQSEIEEKGRAFAEKEKAKYEKNGTATIGNLILMKKEQPNYDKFKEARDKRFDNKTEKKDKKKNLAKMLTDYNEEKIKESNYAKYLKTEITPEEVYDWYLTALLVQAKYFCRQYAVKGGDTKDEK